MTEELKINFYRCVQDIEDPVIQTLGTTITEARRSLGRMGCKVDGCNGPVLLEDTQNREPKKQVKAPLKEWRSGTPPQGKYLLDTGEEMCEVNVGHGIFEREGEVHPISFAFASGTLWGPIREKKEEKNMKGKKARIEHKPVVPDDSAPEADMYETQIDLETREAIRKELLELAQTPPSWKRRSIAPVLVKYFGTEIKASRARGHGWGHIAKIIRKHGLHVSEAYLKNSSEE
jgi:hypothetical protein